MLKHLENYFLSVIKRERIGFFPFFLRTVLRLLSWPFKLFVTLRNFAFDHEWLRRYSPPVPVVISIGNIVVGGTGKTPATLLIASEFYQEFKIAVLSRGYRSPAEKLSQPVALCRGNGPLHPAGFCGDEPFLIAENLPKSLVFVGRDRHQASDMAARSGAQLILLDDGMQHRRLARDLEVIVMDAQDPFGQGYFLPRGLLREGTASLKRADLIIINHVADTETFLEMKRQVQKYSSCLIVGTRMEVTDILDLNGKSIPSVKDKKVGIFCGIAHPDYFQKTVISQGAVIVKTAFTADHVSPESDTLQKFAVDCQKKGAEMLLCTEKDRVKLPTLPEGSLPIAWVKSGLKIVEGEADWKEFIKNARSDLNRRV